jgi:hypothetical protein
MPRGPPPTESFDALHSADVLLDPACQNVLWTCCSVQ